MCTRIGAKGAYLLELCPLVGFQKIKMNFAQNFYVCGPTSMKHTTLGTLNKCNMHGQWVDVACIQESGPRAHNL